MALIKGTFSWQKDFVVGSVVHEIRARASSRRRKFVLNGRKHDLVDGVPQVKISAGKCEILWGLSVLSGNKGRLQHKKNMANRYNQQKDVLLSLSFRFGTNLHANS